MKSSDACAYKQNHLDYDNYRYGLTQVAELVTQIPRNMWHHSMLFSEMVNNFDKVPKR